jgi:hypothetical protein
MPATIGASEVLLAAVTGIAVVLHAYTWRRAVRDVAMAEREGIGNGSMILFRQNRRTELARLHLKLTLLLAALYFLTRPNRSGWDDGDTILVLTSGAVIHLLVNAVLDVRDRERIKRKHQQARAAGWDGADRRAS